MADYSPITEAIMQAGSLDAADVDIIPNPNFTPDVVELIHDYVYDEDADADA